MSTSNHAFFRPVVRCGYHVVSYLHDGAGLDNTPSAAEAAAQIIQDRLVDRPVARGDGDVLLWRVNGALVEASRTDDVRLHVQDDAEALAPRMTCVECGAEQGP